MVVAIPCSSLPIILKFSTDVVWPVALICSNIGDGAFKCSLYLSLKVLADSPMYSSSHSVLPLNITMLLATQHQWKTSKLQEGRNMVWPQPSRKSFTSELITLPLTRILANTTCHIFGTKFCFPSQN